jgi:hypothetical protein
VSRWEQVPQPLHFILEVPKFQHQNHWSTFCRVAKLIPVGSDFVLQTQN